MPLDPLNPSARSGPLGGFQDQPDEQRPFFDAWDAIKAVPRGVVGAAKGVYNLADTITGDALPDWNENPLGESKSLVGGLVEGASQFATGFLVADPLVGFAGRLAGLGATEAAAAATSYKVGKGIVAGAVTDFAVWDGHQQRLSNLVQEVPALRNPITEFLAAKEDDSEIVGRLKGALEGAGLGAALEGVFLGVKKLRVYNRTVEDLTEQAGGAEKVSASKAVEIQNQAALEAENAVPAVEIKKAQDASVDTSIWEPPRSNWQAQTDYLEFTPQEQSLRDKWNTSTMKRDQAGQAALEATTDTARRKAERHFAEWQAKTYEDAIKAPKRVGDRVMFGNDLLTIFDVRMVDGTEEFKVGVKGRSAGVQQWVESNQLQLVHDDSYRRMHGEDLTDLQVAKRAKAAEQRGAPIRETPPSPLGSSRSVDVGGTGAQMTGNPDVPPAPKELNYWGRPVEAAVEDPNAPRPGGGTTPPESPRGTPPPGSGSSTAGESFTAPPPAPPTSKSFWTSHGPKLRATLSMTDEQFTALQARMEDPSFVNGAAERLGVNPRDLNGADRLRLAMEPTDFNLSHSPMPDEITAMFRANEQVMRDAVRTWLPGISKQTLDETNAKALGIFGDLVGAANSEEAASIALRNFAGDTYERSMDTAARINAVRVGMPALSGWVAKRLDAEIASRGLADSDMAKLKAMEAANIYTQTQGYMKGTSTEIGRALHSFNLEIEGKQFPGFAQDLAGNPARVKEIINEFGGAKHIEKQLDMVRAAIGAGGEEGAAKGGKAIQGWLDNPYSKMAGMVKEFWLNSILSGIKTATVNGLGPITFSLYRPLERALGSAVVATAEGIRGNASAVALQSGVMDEAIRQVTELATTFPEIFGTMKELGLNPKDVFDGRSGSSIMEASARRQAIKGANTGFAEGSPMYKAVDALGNVIRFPTAVLGTQDNAIKLWNARGAARAKLMTQAVREGRTAAEASQFVADTMDRLIYNNQVHSPQMLFDRGLAEATAAGITGDDAKMAAAKFVRDQIDQHPTDGALSEFVKSEGWDATLTTPAEEGSWSWSLKGLVARHPMVSFVLPFINTPVNIIKATGQRIDPFGPARFLLNQAWDSKWTALNNSRNRFIREMTSGDPRLQAAAVGRVTAGYSIAATAYALANSGYITGRGPSDPAQQKTLKDAGWMPYSIKTPNGYVSYSRLDPLASLLGSAADLANYAAYAPPEDQSKVSTAAMGIAVALTNNLTNKTYVQGLANFLDAAREPDKNLQKLANNYAGSFVPSLLAQSVSATGDPTTHDVRGMVDAMIARIPGLSSTLPPARNILGEPIKKPMAVGGEWGDWWLPVAYSSASDDSIKNELAALGHGFSPMRRTVGGSDLTDIKVGDTNAYDRWGELVGTVTLGGLTLRDAMRKRISAEDYQRAMPETVGETVSPRVQMLNNVISKYRSQAYRQLLQESPEVLAVDRTLRANQQAARVGNPLSILPYQ